MRITYVILIAFVFFGAASSAATRRPILPPQSDKPDQSNNTFATDLYAQFAPAEGNLFFSPSSLQTALAMAWAGASGRTADEMAKALRLTPDADTHKRLGAFLDDLSKGGKAGGYELSMTNALWGQNRFRFSADYVGFIKKNYHAPLTPLDFIGDSEGSRKTINTWVADQTRNHIKDLLIPGSIDHNTRFVLTNTIYFNGKWSQAFDKSQTREEDFRTASGKKVKASFMIQHAHLRYGEDDAVQVLEVPYGNDELCIRIFLPRRASGLGTLENRLTAPRLAVLADRLAPRAVALWLPRFTIESKPPVMEALSAMGVNLAFDRFRADFSGIAPNERLYLTAVIHKAYIKVDEEGTEAAAATGVVGGLFGVGSQPPPPIEFKADHPFIFAIVHRKTDTMLFMGRLTNP